MKLFSLPLFARIFVLQKMDIIDLFLFSLISRRTLNYAKSKKTIKSTGTFLKLNNEDGVDSLLFEELERNREIIKWDFITAKELDEVNYEFIRINGMPLKCSFTFHLELPTIWCDELIQKDIPVYLHRHFCEVFKAPTDMQISLNLSDLKKFPNTDRVKNVIFEEGQASAEAFDCLLDKCEITHCAVIGKGIHGKIENGSRLMTIHNLMLRNPSFIDSDQFASFDGKHLLVQGENVSSETIATFIEEWIEGEKYTKVESIIVELWGELGLDSGILQRFPIMPFNPNRRPAGYNYQPTMMDFTSLPDTIECADGVDVERRTDGQLATVVVDPDAFVFVVWTQNVQQEAATKNICRRFR